jgi:hypothetical protein
MSWSRMSFSMRTRGELDFDSAGEVSERVSERVGE